MRTEQQYHDDFEDRRQRDDASPRAPRDVPPVPTVRRVPTTAERKAELRYEIDRTETLLAEFRPAFQVGRVEREVELRARLGQLRGELAALVVEPYDAPAGAGDDVEAYRG